MASGLMSDNGVRDQTYKAKLILCENEWVRVIGPFGVNSYVCCSSSGSAIPVGGSGYKRELSSTLHHRSAVSSHRGTTDRYWGSGRGPFRLGQSVGTDCGG